VFMLFSGQSKKITIPFQSPGLCYNMRVVSDLQFTPLDQGVKSAQHVHHMFQVPLSSCPNQKTYIPIAHRYNIHALVAQRSIQNHGMQIIELTRFNSMNWKPRAKKEKSQNNSQTHCGTLHGFQSGS